MMTFKNTRTENIQTLPEWQDFDFTGLSGQRLEKAHVLRDHAQRVLDAVMQSSKWVRVETGTGMGDDDK